MYICIKECLFAVNGDQDYYNATRVATRGDTSQKWDNTSQKWGDTSQTRRDTSVLTISAANISKSGVFS